VGWVQLAPPSSEKYTPEPLTPGVNGQVVSAPALQASSSMLSFAPATTTFGWAGSMATAGSFCLFWENGAAGLPTLTSTEVSEVATAAGAAANPNAATSGSPNTDARILDLIQHLPAPKRQNQQSTYAVRPGWALRP